MRTHWLLLYDRAETILWIEPDPVPPWTRASVMGRWAGDTLLPGDLWQYLAAFARLWATGEPQIWDTRQHDCGRWRTHLRVVEGFPPIAAIGICRQFPPSVDRLAASDRLVCRLLALGLGSKQIGGKLGVSRTTIDNRRARIAQKLGLIDSHSLVAWAGENAEWLT